MIIIIVVAVVVVIVAVLFVVVDDDDDHYVVIKSIFSQFKTALAFAPAKILSLRERLACKVYNSCIQIDRTRSCAYYLGVETSSRVFSSLNPNYGFGVRSRFFRSFSST